MASALFVPWLLTALSLPCQPAAQPPAETKVKVTVVVILASERCQFIDPRLKNVAVELQKSDPNLTGFNLVSMTDMALAQDAKGSFACIEGVKVDILVHQCEVKDKVCLAVTAPLQDEIVYKTVCGKFLPIVTRYQSKERISPKWIGVALLQAAAGGTMGPLMAYDTLDAHRCRDRLILAIRVQPCAGK